MTIKAPSSAEIKEIAKLKGLNLTEVELEVFTSLMEGPIESYKHIDSMTYHVKTNKFPRDSGYVPDPSENPFRAWRRKCEIRGAKTGKLKGKRVAIKDNISVAGIPMNNGTSLLEGYIPENDASVVTLLLEAGATIVGKASCENLCLSGGSHTNDFGTVLNPRNPHFSSGGSSSGSAALLANDEIDIAIGGDQGGSIRIPSSWCGVVGLKPSHGLVPYTGAFPIEQTLDHLGPMGKTVADVALTLDVISAPDQLDPRYKQTRKKYYLNALNDDVSDVKIGLVSEGLNWPNISDQDVDMAIKKLARDLNRCGIQTEEVSIPAHRLGMHIWNAIAIEGAHSQMFQNHVNGKNWKGLYEVELGTFFSQALKQNTDLLSDTGKLIYLLGTYMSKKYNGKYYAKAQNLAIWLTKIFDEKLSQFDALLMPTTPTCAFPAIANDSDIKENVQNALGMIHNTATFDVTGHPALSVPCATKGGDLPIGAMVVGSHNSDDMVLKIGREIEKLSSR